MQTLSEPTHSADKIDVKAAKSSRSCFCQYPAEELKDWIVKKYQYNLSTIELLTSAKCQKDKEEIGMVALLDVGDDMVVTAMRDVNSEGHSVLSCRDQVLKSFKHMKL